MKTPDFLAELKYLSEGGRKSYALSGYRPQLKFHFSELQTSGEQKFINKKKVYPGDNVIAELTLASPQFFYGMLKINMSFEFREGDTIIGTGEIVDIFNKLLLHE